MTDDKQVIAALAESDAPADVVAHAPDGPPQSHESLANQAVEEDAEWQTFFALVSAKTAMDASGDGLVTLGSDETDCTTDDVLSGGTLTPVQAIARAALDAALPGDVRAALVSTSPIALVVSVPGPDWVDEIRMAASGFSSDVKTLVRDGSRRKEHLPTVGNLDIGAWLAGGLHVIGISQAPASFLPSALLAVADATLVVQAPDGATFARILALTGLAPPADIPDSVCAGMSFSEILAAFRKGLDGRGVVDALARIAARKAGADADDGVPPLPDLPGHSGEARAFGTALIADFAKWRRGQRAWRDVSASAVLDGPPGTGKTMFARSLAKALGVQLISTGVGDWFARTEGNLGDVAVAFQSAWDRAMAARPCVFFLDELDAIPDRNSLSNRGRDWWLPIITLILTTTDGAQTARDGLILIGATNHGNRLDSALVRRGRFDRLIRVELPSTNDLAAVVSHHVDRALSAAELEPVMRLSRGASAADAAAWAREARSTAAEQGRAVSVADVAAAVAPADNRSAAMQRRCAVHEAGHAIVGCRLGAHVESVSIVQIGDSGGRTVTDHDAGLTTAADLDRLATVTLGGRAAEAALLGAPSAGAVGDLAQVTALLASVHATMGLGDSLIHRATDATATALLNADPVLRRTVEAHLTRLYADALALVEANREATLRVADALVARRFLTGDEVEALVQDEILGGNR